MQKILQNILIIICFVLSLIGCSRTKPQSPSNRRVESKDSASIALVLMNQRLAQQADKEILDYIKSFNQEQYTLMETGYWYKKLNRTDGDVIINGKEIDLRIIMSELNDNRMLTDIRKYQKVSESQMLFAIWETLLQMHLGEHAVLIVPWYAAYGSTGCSDVPPYTNLKIEIITY